ncbi:Co2+/Mg2+ efflux protein ApaG [Natronospira bacteriovora]
MDTPNNHNILVDVSTRFLQSESDPVQGRYVFAYTITLRNDGRIAAKLLKRHWVITDANGKVQEVHGDGVIGEYPYLQPGESYEYTSGTIIETPVGSMEGSYLMEADDGQSFDAPIAPFRLAVPGVVN